MLSAKYQTQINLTHIFLLLVYMTNLEPDIFFVQWSRRILDDVFETLFDISQCDQVWNMALAHLKTLRKLLLLLVDYAQPEVDFVGFLEVGLHSHDLGEGLLGMLE